MGDRIVNPKGAGPKGHVAVRWMTEDTLEFITPITQGAPIAQRAALAALNASLEMSLEQGLTRELECYEHCLVSEDRIEALRAFGEKRKPQFKGR